MSEKVKSKISVNLPKTGFPMKANLPAREPDIIKFWQENGIYKRIAGTEGKTKGRFVLHDGPPYANGNIHLGHALNKILKDMVVKFKSMDGFAAPYIPGWDCHGLPIEHQLMKQLKTDKRRISREDFRKKAVKFAMKYVAIQKEEFKRLGILSDWDNPYLTMAPSYEYGIVKTFNSLLKKGYIYRSKKPVLWCISCETALADAEVEYENHVSPSIFVRFPVIKGQKFGTHDSGGGKEFSMIIWTTTPWTLPANVAVAVDPNKDYGLYRAKDGGIYIAAAEPLLEKEYARFGIDSVSDKEIVRGEKLLGLRLKHPFRDIESKVVGSKFVQMDTGAGTIHIAPGHGLEDYQVGLENKLPVVSPVDERGMFTDEVPAFQGQRVFAANDCIMEDLKNRKLLLAQDSIEHSYPHCWRCKDPIIFRATEQWFLSVDHNDLRKKMLSVIKKVSWIPDYGEKRITSMVEGRPDWCLSRQRYWGTPLPIIYCEKCHKPVTEDEVLAKIEELFEKNGSDEYYKTDVKDIISGGYKCSSCGGSVFRKEEDILDVWFDSGVSHEAVLADPKLALEWPADMYIEGSDQHRGWFQTSLISAVALREEAPYRAVLTHGFTVDGQGRKMSKSQGNVVAPQEVIKDYGADILRLWVAASDYREDIRVSGDIIKGLSDLYRKIRNTFKYLLGNTCDYNAGSHDSFLESSYEQFWDIDKFVLHRLQNLAGALKAAYESYEFHKVIFYFNQFCTTNLSAFYLDVLKDRLYTFRADSLERRYAQCVLWELLRTLTRLIAPVLSFTAEETFMFMKKEHPEWSGGGSIFESALPAAREKYVSQKMEDEWSALLKVRESVNAALENSRNKKIIGSSLEADIVLFPSGDLEKNLLDKFNDQLEMIFIVSKVSVYEVRKAECVTVEVSKASGNKCARCWRYTEDSKELDGQLICGRCSDAVKE